MTQSTDDRLRIEAAQRDPARFGELYEEHFCRVYAYIAGRVRDRHQAEDLTADVFREALAGIGKFEWRGDPSRHGCCGLRRARLRIIFDVQAGRPEIRQTSRSSRIPPKSSAAPCCLNLSNGSQRRSSA